MNDGTVTHDYSTNFTTPQSRQRRYKIISTFDQIDSRKLERNNAEKCYIDENLPLN